MNVNMAGQLGLGAISGARQAPPPQAVETTVAQADVVAGKREESPVTRGEQSESVLENLIRSDLDAGTGAARASDAMTGGREGVERGGAGDRPPPPPGGTEGGRGPERAGPEGESVVRSLLEDAAATSATGPDISSAYAEQLYASTQEMLIASGD